MKDSGPIRDELLALLACPACEDRPGLTFDPDNRCLACSECGRKFEITEDGIPLLVIADDSDPGVVDDA